MIVYVVVCDDDVRVFTKERDADMIYSEWMSDIYKSSVKRYQREVEEYE